MSKEFMYTIFVGKCVEQFRTLSDQHLFDNNQSMDTSRDSNHLAPPQQQQQQQQRQQQQQQQRQQAVRPNQLSPNQQQRPDLYVDIPHTYVNVYDESQVRGKQGFLFIPQILYTIFYTPKKLGNIVNKDTESIFLINHRSVIRKSQCCKNML